MKKLILLSLSALAWNTAQAADDKKVDFTQEIRPIFQKSCVNCHGEDKQKGKLRLDSRDAALKGGGGGPAMVPGKPDESELYKRIILPGDHDDRMPSEGDPLSKAQTDLIRAWILQGAEWPVEVVDKGPAKPKIGIEKLAPIQTTDAEKKALAKLEEMGISARPIAMNVNWREANLGLQGTNITDAALAALKGAPSLVHLNLRGTSISDAGLAHIKGLVNLVELHLEKTPVTDAGLVHLKGLTNLTYLNLYGTAVTDEGLNHLKGLTDLRNLYVWQTAVTTNGANNLQAALPQLRIDTGWNLADLIKKEEPKKEEKKEEKKN